LTFDPADISHSVGKPDIWETEFLDPFLPHMGQSPEFCACRKICPKPGVDKKIEPIKTNGTGLKNNLIRFVKIVKFLTSIRNSNEQEVILT
jgi:hypothetical protein